MKKRMITRILAFATATLLVLALSLGSAVYKAYAAYRGPEILITEVMPMSQTNDDAYEYIELYNNSGSAVDLKDYRLPYQNVNFTASKVIQPKGVLVVCTRSTTTLDKFNMFYGTSLTQDKYTNLPLSDEILGNSLTGRVLISNDDGLVVSRASYSENDFDAKKSVTYKYPPSGFDMIKLGTKQAQSPGIVEESQIPDIKISVTGVSLDKTSVTLGIGQSIVLIPIINPKDAVNKAVTWSSSSSAADVDQSGLVTGKSTGTAVVTVRTVDGNYTASCIVQVKDDSHVTGVSLDKTSASVETGKSIVLKASVSPKEAANKKVTWSSSSPDVASVDANGTVCAKKKGSSLVTVRTDEGGYTASCLVTVTDKMDESPAVLSLRLNKSSLSIKVGNIHRLVPVATPGHAKDLNIIWKSDNPNAAVVTADGRVIGIYEGEAVITAYTADGKYLAKCVVDVRSHDNGKSKFH